MEWRLDLPHIVLNGTINIEIIFKKISSLFIRDNTTILKTQEIYLERKKNAILIDSLVIESKLKTNFFSMITGREDGVVIRLFPNIQIKKTAGVKRLLAEIAKQIMHFFPEFILGETNLEEYLK